MMMKEIIYSIKTYFNKLVEAVGGLMEIGALWFLFQKATPTIQIYYGSLLLLIINVFILYTNLKKTIKLKVFFLVLFITCIISISPAIYRYIYVNTPYFRDDESNKITEIGFLRFFPTVNAKMFKKFEVSVYENSEIKIDNQISVYLELDPLRSSYVLDSLQGYKIPNNKYISEGHGLRYGELNKNFQIFKENYWETHILPAYEAMKKIQDFRSKENPLLDKEVESVFYFVKSIEWKKKLICSGLLPKNLTEWKWLDDNYLASAIGLRKYIRDLIGYNDLFFRIQIENKSNKEITLDKIISEAKILGFKQAILMNFNNNERIIYKLKKGKKLEIIEGITELKIPAKNNKSFHLIVSPSDELCGKICEVNMSFLGIYPDKKTKILIPVTRFKVSFGNYLLCGN